MTQNTITSWCGVISMLCDLFCGDSHDGGARNLSTVFLQQTLLIKVFTGTLNPLGSESPFVVTSAFILFLPNYYL